MISSHPLVSKNVSSPQKFHVNFAVRKSRNRITKKFVLILKSFLQSSFFLNNFFKYIYNRPCKRERE